MRRRTLERRREGRTERAVRRVQAERRRARSSRSLVQPWARALYQAASRGEGVRWATPDEMRARERRAARWEMQVAALGHWLLAGARGPITFGPMSDHHQARLIIEATRVAGAIAPGRMPSALDLARGLDRRPRRR